VNLREGDHLVEIRDELNKLLDWLNQNPPPNCVTRVMAAAQAASGEAPTPNPHTRRRAPPRRSPRPRPRTRRSTSSRRPSATTTARRGASPRHWRACRSSLGHGRQRQADGSESTASPSSRARRRAGLDAAAPAASLFGPK